MTNYNKLSPDFRFWTLTMNCFQTICSPECWLLFRHSGNSKLWVPFFSFFFFYTEWHSPKKNQWSLSWLFQLGFSSRFYAHRTHSLLVLGAIPMTVFLYYFHSFEVLRQFLSFHLISKKCFVFLLWIRIYKIVRWYCGVFSSSRGFQLLL